MFWNRQDQDDDELVSAQNAGFAEIYIEDTPNTVHEQPALQKLAPPDPESEEKRSRFIQMRRLVDDYRGYDHFYAAGQASLFCKQADFMADFEDDYTEKAPFSMYFPNYQRMSYDQLRTYFTWRSNVRRGTVEKTSYSYVFLYLYELINNIGIQDSRDGLENLVFIWNGYREYEPKLDKYMVDWVKDYYIVNRFSFSFNDLIAEYELLQQFYQPSVCGDYFERYAPVSSYKLERSSFYSTGLEPEFHGCFNHVLENVELWMGKAGLCFEDLVYYSHKGSTWAPFQRALYWPPSVQKGEGKTVRISDTEIYWYENGQWMSSQKRVCRANGRQVVGYIVRRIEQFYRKAAKFKNKLSADRTKLDLSQLGVLEEGEAGFFSRVDAAIIEFYRASQRKPVTINPLRLEKIRANALLTQEKLLTDMPQEEELPPDPVVLEPENEMKQQLDSSGDMWTCLLYALDIEERAILGMILHGVSLEETVAFAQDQGMMFEVLVDSLNQKALDIVGDNIVELSDTAIVFEDYQSDLERVIAIETE